MNALEVRRLTVSYGGRPVLWDVEAAFPEHSLSAIVGPNGAGKSTLLRACVGLVPADAGQALVLGQPARAALSEVAYVPQRNAVDWDFPVTVREVVEMGRYPRAGWLRRLGREHRDAVDAALERVGMSAFADRQIGRLSGGQRQRVFIARALAQETQVLLLDEPFAGVDARTEAALLDLMRELTASGRSLVLVHHDLGTVRRVFDWALLLNVQALACGRPEEALSDENLARAYGTAAAADLEELDWTR
ncbi:MAG: Manganese ABC transporter, ATP-binding protein SitB [uncultured Solirubrobacteraceae bacterium]|uniref:Manganese ABC transporter, ATP-binding protein SitB n=1 Tax=uncultured Solirubrobacteraceae bacterium TaxID=1162706 RepID=A0A6J4SDI9_9ACTN|nr:MAG: Manganese ABC transporter, ATP-binding protein SitB [uncultured Solirubrobacteraceae bacterium]